MSTEQLTLYTAKICPYAQRVELALAEAEGEHTRFEIDLRNKPVWYAPEVNIASKVPAVTYGGPPVPPEQPSPQSTKIAESLVLLEFIADLYPDSGLLPKSPVLRAKARFFIDAVSTKFLPGFFAAVFRGGEPIEKLLAAIETIQELLPKEGEGKFAVGDKFGIADAAILPFIARLEVAISNDYGVYADGDGKKAYATLQTDERFARWKKYVEDLKARESFKSTFDEEYIKKEYSTRFDAARAQRQAQVVQAAA